MKYWEKTVEENLSYEKAKELALEGYYITRSGWDGIHFAEKEDYYILLKTGEIMKNPEEIFDTDKNDWITVEITDEAVEILKKILL